MRDRGGRALLKNRIAIRNESNDRLFDLVKEEKRLYLEVKLKTGQKRILLRDVIHQILKALAL